MAVLSQQVSAAYNEVIKDRNKPFNQWGENAFLKALEEKGFIERRAGGNQIEFTLDIQVNAGADILAADTTAVSTTQTDVLGGAVYDWRPIVSPINWTIHDEAKLEGDVNAKVPFLRSLAENAIMSHDQVLEQALFSTSTDSFLGLQNLVPTTGQPNAGGIDGASAAYWRNYADTYQADGSDILIAFGLAFDTAAKGTGGSQPTMVVSGIDTKNVFESQLTPNQRYEGKTGVAGFEMLKVRSADYIYSMHGGTKAYFLNPRGFKLVVNKNYFRKLEPAERMVTAAMRQKLIFSSAQACISAPSRLAVVSQA